MYNLLGSMLIKLSQSSLVGDEGTDRQYGFVKAIPKTNVQLFSPSDFCLRYCEQGMRMPCMKAKAKVEKASKDAGIPTTVVHVGNFAEFTLSTTSVVNEPPGMFML